MRGKESCFARNRLRAGITPAHAGKSWVHYNRTNQTKDHPRPCGEKPLTTILSKSPIGSPPPMRGKGLPHSRWAGAHRITPAHAGKSVDEAVIAAPAEDHPRPCGEKTMALIEYKLQEGSPPPMRGKELVHVLVGQHHGITPAHAGKRFSSIKSVKILRDHPRPCGEKSSEFANSLLHMGSPPPMRGKVEFPTYLAYFLRITPAHAGKSFLRCLQVWFARDHPRPCGEKFTASKAEHEKLGSPPPMRGKALPPA